MKINTENAWNLITMYYFSSRFDRYNYQFDPALTFQEFLLIKSMRSWRKGEWRDISHLEFWSSEWYEDCVAHLFQPIDDSIPWDQVLKDKREVDLHLDVNFGCYQTDWKDMPEYKELWQREVEYKNLYNFEKERIVRQKEHREMAKNQYNEEIEKETYLANLRAEPIVNVGCEKENTILKEKYYKSHLFKDN